MDGFINYYAAELISILHKYDYNPVTRLQKTRYFSTAKVIKKHKKNVDVNKYNSYRTSTFFNLLDKQIVRNK